MKTGYIKIMENALALQEQLDALRKNLFLKETEYNQAQQAFQECLRQVEQDQNRTPNQWNLYLLGYDKNKKATLIKAIRHHVNVSVDICEYILRDSQQYEGSYVGHFRTFKDLEKATQEIQDAGGITAKALA